MVPLIKYLDEISPQDLPAVGAKNLKLGELLKSSYPQANPPKGFVLTADAYWDFLSSNHLNFKLKYFLDQLDTKNFSNLNAVGQKCRSLIMNGQFSYKVQVSILSGISALKDLEERDLSFAIRSSTIPYQVSHSNPPEFHGVFINVKKQEDIFEACLKCYASLFTNSAIKHSVNQGIKHLSIGLSVSFCK